jgi:hypothetical protein
MDHFEWMRFGNKKSNVPAGFALHVNEARTLAWL